MTPLRTQVLFYTSRNSPFGSLPSRLIPNLAIRLLGQGVSGPVGPVQWVRFENGGFRQTNLG